MSSYLQIVSCKPNPAGKDKTSSGSPKPEQLVAEWVEIKNVGTESVRFSTIGVHHSLFSDRCIPLNKTELYWSGSQPDQFKPGETLRVHTGRKEWESLLRGEDVGRGWRAFAGLDRFVLNNRCGDTLYVTWRDLNGTPQQDSASYDQNPPEGRILYRSGSKLR